MYLKENDKVQVLENGAILVDYGPMHMFISVFENGRPVVTLAKEGAYKAMRILEDLAKFIPVIKRKSKELKNEEIYPHVVRRMIEVTQEIGEPDLTPLAAVAGTTSEVVADFIYERGGTKIIVDNGGDIAIRLRGGETARIGIKTEVDAKEPSYCISIHSETGIGGIATSGLGGRSFTKGIASAVTVLSKTASMADTAATVVGNYTDVEDSAIVRSLAEKIYPDTDLQREWVTLKVGKLSQGKIDKALKRGLVKAEMMWQKGFIKGALIAVQGKVVWTDSMNSWLTGL